MRHHQRQSEIYETQAPKKRKKDTAGSDDTASMIKGGGYVGARTRHQAPHKQSKF